MTATVLRPRPTPSRPSPAGPGGGLLGALDDRRRALAGVGPNWFATVMGTSIVATAAVDLPVQVPGQRVFAQVVWVLAGLLLTAVGAATVGDWGRFPDRARRLAADPVMAHFYGAVPMALLAFGAATLVVGVDLIGAGAAVGVDWVLWLLGTVLGLACAVVVPYLMVSAATGAALIPHAPAGQLPQTLLDCCYAMFGISLLASIVVVTLLWGRLARFKVGAAAAVPTLWIVLGPLGQSVTAANALGAQAPGVLRGPYATAARALGLIYGLPVWGFAMMWAALAITTGTDLFRVAAAVFFIGLLAAWITVAARTTYGTWTGELLR
ncbi:MAG: C4-dicarboxylate transporter/malic acid transport protein [Blastococcus sp.]|nr:C4-dicarboxylate transporter/malic acid transport protein [Blastococcus sp.]